MKPREPVGLYERARRDIYEALATQPFPVRGWHLRLAQSVGKKNLYPVHSTAVPVDEEGIPTVRGKPAVLFEVDAMELILTADFRLEACFVLGGQPWRAPQEAVEKQWLRFANTNGSLELILDTKPVPPYQERLYYVDRESWLEHVSHWTKKWNESGRRDRESRWVLVQLDGIRNSGNHTLEQALMRLVSRIQKEVPDYWFFAELAMAGKLTEKEIQTLESYEVGKGAITIRQTPRPQMVPTEKVQ
jgi:hypothetical protein